jgi:diacylglycerol kinase family enzyme
VTSVRCRKLTITSPDPLLVNLDGEETTHLPATIEIMPGVLPFKLPQP